MPLKLPSELRFPMGATVSLEDEVVNEFISLIRKITGSGEPQQVVETFKKHFCKVSNDYYARSSSMDWAESDMSVQAYHAAQDAPNFIAAIYDALEELRNRSFTVPTSQHINQILNSNNINYRISGDELIQNVANVSTPELSESVSNTVMRALGDAKALIGTVDSSSAIDRAHTALHGYLVQLCVDNNINLPHDPTVSKAFKELRKSHSALQATGNRSDEITRILQSFANSIDAFSTLRNKASLAHVNELLEVPEATATVNAMYTVFRYIQDSIQRHHANCTPKLY